MIRQWCNRGIYADPNGVPAGVRHHRHHGRRAQEVARQAQPSPIVRLLPIVTAIATVGAMAVAYYSRSAVARNPAFLIFPLMMLVSTVTTVISNADRRRSAINAERADYLATCPTCGPTSSIQPRHSISRCSGAIRLPTRYGPWRVAAGCGSGAFRTQTFVRCESDLELCRLPRG